MSNYMTIWIAVKIPGIHLSDIEYIPEMLSMNGYTFDTNGDNVIFIWSNELEYLKTILNDEGIAFEIL